MLRPQASVVTNLHGCVIPVLPQTCCPPDCGVSSSPECDVAPRGLRSWELSLRNEKALLLEPCGLDGPCSIAEVIPMNDPAVTKGGHTRRRGFGLQTAEPHPSYRTRPATNGAAAVAAAFPGRCCSRQGVVRCFRRAR